MITLFGKLRYHWQPDLAWAVTYWSLGITPIFFSFSLLYERLRLSEMILVLFLIFVGVTIAGFHRYFVIHDTTLQIASANLFARQSLLIENIEKIEVNAVSIALITSHPLNRRVFYMRKWPKKYFVNALVLNPHFRGEVVLSDHMQAVDYFEEYYSEKS